MTQANCEEIRRELDELMLDDDYGVRLSTHLRECSHCRDFQEKQTKLRQIVGSLGTVSAPSDFDFKLRARLANENSGSSFQLSNLFAFGQRSAAVATVLVLLVGALVFVRYLVSRSTPAPVLAVDGNTPAKESAPAPTATIAPKITSPERQDIAGNTPPQRSNSPVRQERRIKTRLVAQDSALTAAEVISSQSPVDTEQVFPIDASQQSLRVSLFDKKGNPKTISLPPVSFGSQRVVPTATSYAPKGVW